MCLAPCKINTFPRVVCLDPHISSSQWVPRSFRNGGRGRLRNPFKVMEQTPGEAGSDSAQGRRSARPSPRPSLAVSYFLPQAPASYPAPEGLAPPRSQPLSPHDANLRASAPRCCQSPGKAAVTLVPLVSAKAHSGNPPWGSEPATAPAPCLSPSQWALLDPAVPGEVRGSVSCSRDDHATSAWHPLCLRGWEDF